MIYGLYNIATVLSGHASLPKKAHGDEDAAFDLCASEKVTIYAGDTCLVPTGLSVVIPEGCAGLILPRSGLASRHGLTVINAPGLIDPGYRGEVKVPLHLTLSGYDVRTTIEQMQGRTVSPSRSFDIAIGDRIAQLLIVPTVPVHFLPTSSLEESERGSGGFGSTGL
jgi:dUTP pyrophosphatase